MHGCIELNSTHSPRLAQSLHSNSMKRLFFLLLAGLACHPLIAQNGASGSRFSNAAFAPGETLSYRFHYGLLDAAEAVITVKGSKQNSDWIIDAKGRSVGAFNWFFKVDDHYQSHIDPRTGLPNYFLRDIREGGYKLHQDYTFNQSDSSVFAVAFKGKNNPKQTQHELQGPVYDMVSGIYALRNIAFNTLAEGDTVSVPIFMDEEWFDLQAVYAGNENIKWKGQKWNCALIYPVIQTGRIWRNPDDLAVYITNDTNRIPLLASTRILFGSIKMELTNASGLRSPLGFAPN